MKANKIYSLALGLLIGLGAIAQTNTAVVLGLVANNAGMNVPVTIQTISGTPSYSSTVSTDASGAFADSIPVASNPGFLTVTLTDCNGNIVIDTLIVQFSPAVPSTIVTVQLDYCPGSGNVDCLGVPNGNAVPGSPCFDPVTGTPGTWDANCTCNTTGTGTVDCMGIPGGFNLPGTPCLDSLTGNVGVWDTTCVCQTNSQFDCNGVPGGPDMPGTSCVDFLGNQGTWDANCICQTNTLPVDCNGVPGGPDVPGASCTDPVTGNMGTWDANCACITGGTGTVDCLGVAGGTALPGTLCTDSLGNNGIWTQNCVCLTNNPIVDCMGVAGGLDLPGFPCDDNDPNTFNDTWDLNCNCAGFAPSADCNGVIGGPDVPGAPCNDNDSTTYFDHWDYNCNCTGLPFNPNFCSAQYFAFQAYDSAGVIVPNTLNVVAMLVTPTPLSGISFLWDFGDGNTSTDPFPTHTYSGNGPYNLCVTIDDGNCTDTFCDSVSVDASGVIIRGQSGFTISVSPGQLTSTSIDENAAEQQIGLSVFPNPATDILNIQPDQNVGTIQQIEVLDVHGRLVRSEGIASSSAQLSLNIAGLEEGMYIVRLATDKGMLTERFIKKFK